MVECTYMVLNEDRTKTCRKCGAVKSLTEFNRNIGRSDGVQTYCAECNREYQRLHKSKSRTRQKARDDWRRIVEELQKRFEQE